MPRRAALSAAGRLKLASTGVTIGGTGVGTVPSVPAGAVNVKTSQGAVGNGTTDDGAAIRAAVTAAGAGGTVYFPAGTYRYVATGTLQLNGTDIIGAGQGTTTILYESSTTFRPFFQSTGDNVKFHSLTIKRNSSIALVMFPLTPFTGLTFDNVLIDGNRSLDAGVNDVYCFQVGQSGTLSTTKLLNSTFKNFSQYPLFQDSADTGTVTGFEVRNCVFQNNYRTHLEFNAPNSTMNNLTVENNSFLDQYGPGAGGFGVGFANCHTVSVQYNLFQNSTQEGVHVEDRSSGIEVAWNQFIQCGTVEFSSVQIVTAASDVRVRHNVIDGTGSKGTNYIAAIAALGGGGTLPSNIIIDDNTIDRGTNGGIYHQCTGVTVTNNRFNPSVGITNGGSSGTVTNTNNTVSITLPVGFPGTGGGGGGSGTTVAFDAVGPNSAGATATTASSISWSHTCSGTNRYVAVGIALGNSPDSLTLSATYGGVSMTSLGLVHSNNNTVGYVQLFGLVAPATGAQTVAVTVTGGTADGLSAGSVSFTGVHQTTPVGTPVTGVSTTASVSASVTAAVGNMIVSATCQGTTIASSGNTLRWLRNTNSNTAAGNGAGATAAGTGSAVSMSFTSGTADWWGIIAVEIKAAP